MPCSRGSDSVPPAFAATAWRSAAGRGQGTRGRRSLRHAREEWRTKYQRKATPEQSQKLEATTALHAFVRGHNPKS